MNEYNRTSISHLSNSTELVYLLTQQFILVFKISKYQIEIWEFFS